MSYELIYFIVFLFIFIVFLGAKKILDIKSDQLNPGRTVMADASRLIKRHKIFVRLFKVTLFAYAISVMAHLMQVINIGWLQIGLADSLRIISFFVGISSVLFLNWVYLHLAGNWAKPEQLRKKHKIVTTGPYKWLRNPMYLAGELWLLSLIMITNFWPLIPFLPYAHYLFYKRAKLEEKILLQRFGNQYLKYKKRTNMFIPRI